MIMSVEVSRRHLPRLSTVSHKDLDKHILRLVSSLSILSHLNFKHFLKKIQILLVPPLVIELFAYFCIKRLWQTVRYSKGCHALIYRLSSLTRSCFIYKHDAMMIHWCINAPCSAISQIKGLHTRCVILNQTRDLTCPWLMTHFRLDSSCDTLSPVLTISLLPRQRNKIQCVLFLVFF